MADDPQFYTREDPIEPAEPERSPDDRSRVGRILRGIGKGVLILLAVVLVLVLAVVLLLQTEFGRGKVQEIAVGQIQNLLAENATVRIDRLGGTLLTNAQIEGLEISLDGEPVLTLDTARADYNLLALLERQLDLGEVYAAGLDVVARQNADSVWNVTQLLAPAPEDTTASAPFTITVGEARLARARAKAHFYNAARDSILTVDGLNARASDIFSGPERLAGSVDTLYATAVPPAPATGTATGTAEPVRLAASGAFGDDTATLDGLLVTSTTSDVRASGTVDYSNKLTFDLDLLAAPLDFADVRAFAPVDVYGTAEIRLQAQGTPEDILARVNADFAENGRIDLNGAFSAGDGGPVRYAAAGEIVDFNPGRLLGNEALDGSLTADLDVDLRGDSRETLGGTVDLQVRGSTLAEQQIQRIDLVGTFTDGLADFTLGGAVPGARLLARGTARPFAEVPRYDVRGELNDVDLSRLLNDPEQQGQFAGTFAVEGRGIDPQTANATATVRLARGQFGEIDLEQARLDATLADGVVRYDTEVTFADEGGLVAAEGTLRPFAEPLAYRVDEGRFENFDLAAVTGDTLTTDLTGTFALSGSGTDPQGGLALDLALNLRDSRYDRYAITGADLAANLRRGQLTFDVDADLAEAGALDAEGTAQPFADPITYQAQGNLRNLDLAVLTGNPDQSSDLNGAFRVDGTGTDPQTLAADVRLDLQNSRFREQQITSGTIDGSLRGGALDLTVDATTPDGALDLTASGRPFDDNPTFRLGQSSFRGLNLAQILDNPNFDTDLNGTIEFDAAGFDPGMSEISGRLVLLPSRINDARIDEGTVQFDLEQGYAEAEADIDFEQGAAAFSFTGRPFDETPTYTTTGNLDSLNVAALAGGTLGDEAVVNLAFDLDGRGFDPATAEIRGTLRGGDSRIVGATVDTLRTAFVLTESVLTVDNLLLRSSLADATAEGQIALLDAQTTQRTDLTFDAEIKDTEPLNALLDQTVTLQEGSVNGSVRGDPGQPLRIDVQAEAQQFAFGEIRASTLDVRLNGEYLGAAADSTTTPDSTAFGTGLVGTARIEFGFLSLPTVRIEGGDINATYDGTELAVGGEVGIDARRDLDFSLRTDLNPEQQTVSLETLTFAVDDERWELLQEATISYGERFRFRNLLLYAGDQQIAVDGVVDFAGEQNLVLTVEQFDLASVTDLVGYDGVGGTLTTTLLLSGPAASPEIEGSLRVDSLVSGGQNVGSLDIDLSYQNFRLGLDALLTHVSGRELVAEGTLPLEFSLSSEEGAARVGEAAANTDVDFTVRADSFPVAWAEPFLPPEIFTEVGGGLNIDLAITGTQANPQLSGSALLADGRLGLVELGRTIRNVQIPLTFDRNTVRIGEAVAGAGDNGRLAAEGTITLPKLSLGELALAIEMDNFRVIDTRTYHNLRLTTRDGPLLFQGTTEFPQLTGAITLDSGDIYLTEELTGPDLAEVELTEAQIQRIEATFGTRITEADTARSVFVQNLALDLDVEIERNVWLRSRQNPVFDIEFAGTILVEKEPGGENQLFRSIEIVRGYVELYGRSFDVERGTLTFNGPVSETLVNIEAAFRVPARQGSGTEATINLTFAGRLGAEGEQAEDGLELTLSSDPPMENTDIVSYIATGKPAGEAFQGGGGVGNLFASQISSLVEGLAASSLGLDVVEVTQRPDGALAVAFGVYLTNRTYAQVSQVVTEGQNRTAGEEGSRLPEATIEYQLLNWLLMRLERRNLGGTGGAAQVEISY